MILHFWIESDLTGNYINSKSLKETIKSIKMILKDNNQSIFWILVLSRWGPKAIMQKILFDGGFTKEYMYIGHEWLVFKNGKELTDFYGNIGIGDKINYI